MEIIRSSFWKNAKVFIRPDRQRAESKIIVFNHSPKNIELCKEKKMKYYDFKEGGNKK